MDIMDSSPNEAVDLEIGSKALDFDEPDIKTLRRSKTIRLGPSATSPWTGGQSEDGTHHVSFRLADLEIDKEQLFSGLDCHRRFKVKEGYEMKDLPKFNDLTRYDVTEDQEMDLWKLEVDRLVTAVKSETPPSLEGDPEWYGGADSDGYNRLHVMAASLKHALSVCIHDNELVLLEHQPPLANKEMFVQSHRSLLRNFDPDEGIIRFDKKIKLAQHSDEVYHGLVNYLTAILARLLVRTITGRFWVDNCLITIAKFAAKLKVLGNDLPRAVALTIEAHRDVQMRVGELTRSQPGGIGVPEATGKENPSIEEGSSAWSALDIGQLDMSGARYFIVLDAFDRGIVSLLLNCLGELRWDEEVEQTAEMFETSTVIYGTGFRGMRMQLCQERDGSIGVAADRNVMHCAGVAFDVCREVWTSQPSAEGLSTDGRTTLDWNWTGLVGSEEILGVSSPGSRSWTDMRDVITALVPYTMFCGIFPTNLSQFARQVIQISDFTNSPNFYTQQSCLAAARVRTSQYEGSLRKRAPSNMAQFQNVYDTPMAREGALSGMQGDPESPASRELRQKYLATGEKFRNAMDEVERWVMDERSIVITSLWYSWIVLAAVGVLLCGGVAMIAVEDRISGVDPSNLTVLVWTAAGFLVVYFKSMRVENWPWRDFLRGRVVCRSVSEVQAVTKIDPQVLLAILMRFESRVLLGKCGPFRGIFDRKVEDGFAIDVPPTTMTAAAGGCIFVRVLSVLGPALSCLEARNRELYRSVSPQGATESGTGYICRDFIDPAHYQIALVADDGEERDAARRTVMESLPLYPLCTNALSWYRVQGVFVEKAMFL
ncbi:hypothetical protein BGZ61DRAFT_593014 [Ilyonectria robusta]|uniref:uncharacterized protein n=1 Tax=Ilyonectria robusta TaxID=1079257 RepID=UPI001E8D5EFF|nr:uncharacterized protein BGZ61DRAFT_593014 [Ilyonectria robusta]KAH8665631.1 hypothetical protein BGZ61DRAFT_593014 [Ilyonectria robusta]